MSGYILIALIAAIGFIAWPVVRKAGNGIKHLIDGSTHKDDKSKSATKSDHKEEEKGGEHDKKGGQGHHGPGIWSFMAASLIVIAFFRVTEILGQRFQVESAPYTVEQTDPRRAADVTPVSAPTSTSTASRVVGVKCPSNKEKPYELELDPGEFTPIIENASSDSRQVFTLPTNGDTEVLKHYFGEAQHHCGPDASGEQFCAQNMSSEKVVFKCYEDDKQ